MQDPLFSQSFNRYAYAWNNPLSYTDPDGEFIFTVLLAPFGLAPLGAVIDAACWGAVIGGATYTAAVAFSNGGFNNWSWNNFWNATGMGAISGAVTFGIGSMFGSVGSAGLYGEFGRAFTHGWANGIMSMATGGNPLSGFASGD